MVEYASVKEGDPLAAAVGRFKAPGFCGFLDGKLLFKAEAMPKSNELYAGMRKAVSAAYKTDLEKVVAKVKTLQKELDKIADRKTVLQDKLARLDENDKEKQTLTAEMDQLAERETKLNAEIDGIVDLESQRATAADKEKIAGR